jgi:membrane associated rhomboid family serine protease
MDKIPQKKATARIYLAAFVPMGLCIVMILSYLLQLGMHLPMYKLGVFPLRLESLTGIFTMIFVHADWKHLLNNLLSFSILSVALYYFYNTIANKVMIFSTLLSGTMLWFIGRDSWHVGASGLIYAIAFFLFFSGLFRRHTPLVALSLIVAFLYGSMVWHVFPWEAFNKVSWEGHLSGAIVGFVLSVLFRKQGSQKPIVVWDEEIVDDDDENEMDFYGEDEIVDTVEDVDVSKLN